MSGRCLLIRIFILVCLRIFVKFAIAAGLNTVVNNKMSYGRVTGAQPVMSMRVSSLMGRFLNGTYRKASFITTRVILQDTLCRLKQYVMINTF